MVSPVLWEFGRATPVPAFYELPLTPSGYFWAVPHVVGSSHEELAAVSQGAAPDERVLELKRSMGILASYLCHCEAGGRC